MSTTSATTTSSTNPYAGLMSNSTVSASSSSSTASTKTTATSSGNTQDLAQTFLQLLVAQMNNQDPLNPVDNNQITTQMAQISTVTGINTLNSTVSSMVSQLQQSSALQAGQLTGHSALVAGSDLTLSSNSSSSTGASAVGGYSLAAAASKVTVTITDASGNTVNTLNLGTQSAGLQNFSWDGTTSSGSTAAAGNYTFSVAATSSTGASVGTTAYDVQQIVGTVPQTNGSIQLMLGNGTQVPYSSVAQII